MEKKTGKAKSLKEIAEELKMHPSSLSKIINSKEGFTSETRERVMQKIWEYNYKPNNAAIALKYSATAPYRLVILITDFHSSFINAILTGLEYRIRENNQNAENQPIEMVVHSRRSEENTAIKEDSMLKNIVGRKPSAIISVTAPVPQELYRECADRGIPLILIEDDAGGAEKDAIRIDNRKAGAMAADKLLEWGARNIAFISGPTIYRTQKDRCDGFKEGLARNGMEISSVYYYHNARYYTMYEGEAILYEWILKRPGIDGIFCAAGDTIAAGIYSTMVRDFNIKNFNIIGFDGNQIREFHQFPTFAQPIEDFVEKSYNMAVAAMTGGISRNPLYLKMKKESLCDYVFVPGYMADATFKTENTPEGPLRR